MSQPVGLFDIGVAASGNFLSGDMWLPLPFLEKPDPDMPPMFLVGQDVLWTAGVDFAVPWGVSGAATLLTGQPEAGAGALYVTDFFTTIGSAVYDIDRAMGGRTRLNAGVTINGEGVILYYP